MRSIFTLLALLVTVKCLGQNKILQLQDIQATDATLYNLLMTVKTEENVKQLEEIGTYSINMVRPYIIRSFFSISDTGIFNNIPKESLLDDSVVKHKLYILRSCSSLVRYCSDTNYEHIIANINSIYAITMCINEGEGLNVMKSLTEAQRSYIRPFLLNGLSYYDDYQAVSSAYNPNSPLPIKESRLKEIEKTYTKPIQQALIKKELRLLSH